jgi:hypothetical protein
MDDKQLLITLNQRINLAISLLSEIALQGERISISDKAQYLLNMGLPAAMVAEILNKPTNYITAIAHRKKKKDSKQK